LSNLTATPPFKIGIVSYLNVQPLIWQFRNEPEKVTITSEIPRKLAESLYHGAYDSAIVPVFEALRHPGIYSYIPGSAIAATGPVDSVMLYSSCPLENIRTVYLDSSSLTSVNLFKVIAAERGLQIEFRSTEVHPVPLPLPGDTAWVVIGDPAIAQREKHPFVHDLAGMWVELTGLPFVFAAWLVPRAANPQGLGTLLREAREWGMAHLPEIAAATAEKFGTTPEFALSYFSNSLHFDLGEEEMKGWRHFGKLCHKHGLIPSVPEIRPFID
jgi:chorismate dehydratase